MSATAGIPVRSTSWFAQRKICQEAGVTAAAQVLSLGAAQVLRNALIGRNGMANKKSERVRETFEDEVTERDSTLSLQEHVFSMLPREKFKRGDKVRVTVELLRPAQRRKA
jgi:hypothetical protein